MKTNKLFLLFAIVLLWSCNPHKYDYSPVNKVHPKDPFASTISESEFFEINAGEDVVIEGKQGIIITIPAGSLLSKGEQPVKGNVKVELTEALSLSDMVFSNLTTSSNGEILSTGGMFFINFTQNNEQLVINKELPIYVQIPKLSDKDMLLYRGERDSLGNMNWTDPQRQKKYLIPVELSSLNFIPIRFEQTLSENLPVSGVAVPNRKFTDSLYYTIQKTYTRMQAYTPQYNASELIEPNGKKIIFFQSDSQAKNMNNLDSAVTEDISCGINPLSVKVLKDERYKNTFIASKEFETRMQSIHNTCRQDILDVYVNNLDKDLWKVDEMAAQKLKGTEHESIFIDYAAQKLENVKDAADNIYAKTLGDYFRKKTESFEKQENDIQQKVQASLEKKDKEYIEELNKYQEILRKREQNRMEYFGYELRSTGWCNVDTGTGIKNWTEKQVDVNIQNEEKFEMLNTYIWMPNNQSLMRMIAEGDKLFTSSSAREYGSIPLEKGQDFTILAVGKIGNRYYFNQVSRQPDETDLIQASLRLKETPKSEIDNILNKQSTKANEADKIQTDLNYQAYFYERETAYNLYINEFEKITQLYNVICKCCTPKTKTDRLGKQLFDSNCKRCHTTSNKKLLGPGLGETVITETFDYFKRFTKNPNEIIQSGDKRAIEIYDTYNKSLMPAFDYLTDAEISAIYEYLKFENNCNGMDYATDSRIMKFN